MSTGPVIELSAAALRNNLRHAKATLTDGALMLAVKSNAYGHGDELIVPVALDAGVDEFAVLDIDTALRIRQHAPHTPLLAWLLCPGDRFREAADAGVELGVSALWQLDEIASATAGTPVTIHIKIDTGLNRNGASREDWPELVSRAATLQDEAVVRVRGIWSHLSDTSVAVSREALGRLHEAVAVAKECGLTPEIIHLAASHAAVELPETRLDLIRLGILAYGVSPFDGHSAEDLGFRPVLTLSAPIDQIASDGTVTLGVGFTHGWLPTVEPATIPIAGVEYRLDEVGASSSVWRPVTRPAEVRVGEMVPLFGRGAAVTIEEWAQRCHTIGDEVLAKLSPHIPRVFID